MRGRWGMTANGCGISFGGEEDVLEVVVIKAQLG